MLLLLAQIATADSDPLTFIASLVSLTDQAREPTLSYAPNGTLWYSGMTGDDGNLWWAVTDSSDFKMESDPPTEGGTDAVIHHDAAGRAFWAEMFLTVPPGAVWIVEVAVREGGVWHRQDFVAGDRPWFRTNANGVTFLAFSNTSVANYPRVEVWTNVSGQPGWSAFSAGPNNVSAPAYLSDFTNHIDGTLYLLMLNATSQSYFVAYRAPNDSAWTYTQEFPVSPSYRATGFGLPRVVVDLAKNLYVVYGDNITSTYSTWLRHNVSNGWSAAYQLGPNSNTTALPAAMSGSAGRVGVGWYEANGSFLPSQATSDTVWRYAYAIFQNADTVPSLVNRTVIAPDTHRGGMPGFLGDFSYGLRRQGDNAGKVVLAFACDGLDQQFNCHGSSQQGEQPPFPAFARQTAGPGLLS